MLTSLGQAQPSKTEKIHYLQKQSAQIIFSKDRLCHSWPLLKKSKCSKGLSDIFVSKSKLHAQNQNGKHS